MQSHRNYYWAVTQRPVSVEYPFMLPHPDAYYVHLCWERKLALGVHRVTTQHLLHVSPWGHQELPTDATFAAMASNFLHEMAELKLLQELGFQGYHLMTAAIVRPEILRSTEHMAVAAISWQDVTGGTVQVETFHDIHRRSLQAADMSKLYESGTIDVLFKDDKWNVSVHRGPCNGANREVPDAPTSYRNMYRLHAGISSGKGPVAIRVPGDSERTYTFAATEPLTLNTSRGNKLYTVPTVDNFDECWLYVMVIGEGHAQFYFTDFRDFNEIDELSRVGIRELMLNNPNAGFTPERVEFVRVVHDSGMPTVMLESGLLVNL